MKNDQVMVPRELLTQDHLKELLRYDPASGLFTRISMTRYPGLEMERSTGSHDGYGYLNIRIDGRRYLAHRLAWLYMTGGFPERQIDHVNRVRDDNRWENLRESSFGENQTNAGPQSNNSLGVKNVHRVKNGSFRVAICKEGNYHYKILKTLEEAASWASAKRAELHGEFAFTEGN